MAYIKKKGSSNAPKVEKLPYKGVGATVEKLPYRGGKVEVTPLKKEAKKRASSSVKGTVSGIGATVTKTNRATGETTTNKRTLTPQTKSSFNSGSGKMMRTATPRKEEATSNKLLKNRNK